MPCARRESAGRRGRLGAHSRDADIPADLPLRVLADDHRAHRAGCGWPRTRGRRRRWPHGRATGSSHETLQLRAGRSAVAAPTPKPVAPTPKPVVVPPKPIVKPVVPKETAAGGQRLLCRRRRTRLGRRRRPCRPWPPSVVPARAATARMATAPAVVAVSGLASEPAEGAAPGPARGAACRRTIPRSRSNSSCRRFHLRRALGEPSSPPSSTSIRPGRWSTSSFTETRDGDYNRRLAAVLRAMQFRPGTRPDGTPLRMKAQVRYEF